MRRKLRHFIFIAPGIGFSALAFATTTYVAKKGDVLSSIAHEKIKGRVWGKQGSLNTILALNPTISNQDLIYTGQEIRLPDDVIAEATATQTRSVASTSPTCEVKRTPASDLAAAPTDAAPLTPPVTSNNALFELSPYYGLTSLQAIDKATSNPATLASSVNAGLDVHYYQLWSESFKTFIDLNLGTLSFEQPTDSTKSVQNSSTFTSGIGIGADFSLSSALTFRVFGEYQKEAFVRSASTDAVTVDEVSVPELGGSLSLDLLKKNSLTLGVSGDFSELFQAATTGYTVQQGNEYGGKLYFKQNVGGSALQTELGYFSRQQNTSITNQTERDFVVRFRWFLPFGK